MTSITRRSVVKGGALATAGLVTGLGKARAQEVTLRLHQFLPPQANVPKHVLDPWADKVEKDSGGRIKVERFPSMTLGGKPPELIDQATDGVVDIIWTVNGYTPGRFPRSEVFELPFMMTNAEATSRAYWAMFDKEMKETEFSNVHILGTWVHGPGVIHSNKPVETIADLKGLKLRAPTRVITGMLEQFGATAIGMPVPAIPEALSKGVIDGCVIPWEVTPALHVSELVQNHTEFGGNHALYTTAFVLAMNKGRYDGLPDDLRKVIDDNSGMEFSAFAGRTQAEWDAPGRKIAVENGNNIITLTADQTAPWEQAAQPVIDNWANEMDGKNLDGKGLLEEARALIAKYSA